MPFLPDALWVEESISSSQLSINKTAWILCISVALYPEARARMAMSPVTSIAPGTQWAIISMMITVLL